MFSWILKIGTQMVFSIVWPGSAFIRLNIVATHAVGKTIFWRPEKK
jgi:hypothetical protein